MLKFLTNDVTPVQKLFFTFVGMIKCREIVEANNGMVASELGLSHWDIHIELAKWIASDIASLQDIEFRQDVVNACLIRGYIMSPELVQLVVADLAQNAVLPKSVAGHVKILMFAYIAMMIEEVMDFVFNSYSFSAN